MLHNNEWHSTLTVPVGAGIGSITVNANYDAIPQATLIDSINYLLFGVDSGKLLSVVKKSLYAIPPSPKGVVFLFHGTGGTGELFFEKYERYSVVKDLVYSGFAVFTLDANENTMGDQNGDEKIRWHTANAETADESNNVDINNVKALKDSVIADFSLPLDIPCFSLGFSDGANFSDICASALGFNASTHITASGIPSVYTRLDIVPVIWIMAENDQNENADNAAGFDNYTLMSANQVAEWHWFKRSPAYSQRFVRSLNTILAAQSDSVFKRLQSEGYLTADSMLTYASVDSIPASILNSLGLTLPQIKDIRRQLFCLNADHVVHSDFNKNIIRFYNQTLSPSSLRSKNRNNRNNQKSSVYPNPFINKTTIEFSYRQNEHYTFKLFNILGQVVQTISNISNNRIEVRRKNLRSGVYFYQLRSNGKIHASGKLIIN